MRLNIREQYANIYEKKHRKIYKSWKLLSTQEIYGDLHRTERYLNLKNNNQVYVYIRLQDDDYMLEEFVEKEIYYSSSGKKHRENGPAYITYYPNKSPRTEEYYRQGVMHREDGPAEIIYDKNGNVSEEKWFQNNERHRTDGPAVIFYYPDGNIQTEEYRVNNILHREGGKPAIISYYPNGNIQQERYYINNSRHREDGPAEIIYNRDGTIGYEGYYTHGKRTNSKEY